MLKLRYRDLSIQRKISFVIVVGMTSAILVAVINFISFDHLRVKQSLLAEMQVLAKITAARSGAGVMFGLDENAVRDLEALSFRSSIQKACMYRIDDDMSLTGETSLFSSYYREGNPYKMCPPSLEHLELGYHFGDALVVEDEILYKDRVRGYITITSDLTSLIRRQRDWLYTGVLVMLAGLIVAFLMTRRMQRAIVHPIVNLANVMDEIKQDNDLTLRAAYSSEDEVGVLVASFNNMLDIIYRNNLDLDQLYKDLVEKSAEAEATAASLEVSNNHIKDIFGSAAHDLRQPLQAMAIFTDTLLRVINNDEQKDLVLKLQQAMNNLNDLFGEILNVSRYDFDLNIVGTKPTPIRPLLSKVSLEFEAMAEAKGLRFRLFSSDHVVVAHAALLERIIRNLLSNAIKYTDEGGVLLGCRRREGNLVIEVWDTGCGIAEEKIDQTFIRFVQVNEAGWEKRSGYGIGLAIVKKFVDSLDYKIEVSSRVGRGSVFRLTVPLAEKKTSPGSTAGVVSEVKPVTQPHVLAARSGDHYVDDAFGRESRLSRKRPGRFSEIKDVVKMHAVLIDDDPNVRAALKILLERWEMTVSDFESIEEMSAAFASKAFPEVKLIVSDYNLSDGETGVEAIETARKVLGASIPAFIVSGAEKEACWEAIRQSGIPAIRKPIQPARMRAMINHLVK